ncbi:hypothetical protein IIB79_08115, partial [candidate division KSB1 bacterium]|nr:hypothetical protein [candidate division KSB1 bacterium]
RALEEIYAASEGLIEEKGILVSEARSEKILGLTKKEKLSELLEKQRDIFSDFPVLRQNQRTLICNLLGVSSKMRAIPLSDSL